MSYIRFNFATVSIYDHTTLDTQGNPAPIAINVPASMQPVSDPGLQMELQQMGEDYRRSYVIRIDTLANNVVPIVGNLLTVEQHTTTPLYLGDYEIQIPVEVRPLLLTTKIVVKRRSTQP